MRAKAILVIGCFFTLQAVSQDNLGFQRITRCRFSGGTAITVTYSLERAGSARLVTDEELATVKGINIPAGEYTVVPTTDSHDNWYLNISDAKKSTAKREPSDSVSVPLSVIQQVVPLESFRIGFDHTGGSCIMQWESAEPNVRFLLEFSQKNSDVPLRATPRLRPPK